VEIWVSLVQTNVPATNASTYGASGDKSFSEERRRLLKRDLLAAVVGYGADRSEEQIVLEPDLLRLAVVLDVDVDRHREAAIARLGHLVRRFFDHCNAKRNSSVEIPTTRNFISPQMW